MMLDVYGYALSELSAGALQKVTERLIKGQIERASYWSIPIPPELAAMVREEERALRNDLRRLMDTHDTLEDIAVHQRPKDDAAKARVRQRLEAFRSNLPTRLE
jgi:hypothetical protein